MCTVEIQNAEYRTERMTDRKSVDFFWNVTRKVPQVRSRDFNNTMRGVVLAAQKSLMKLVALNEVRES